MCQKALSDLALREDIVKDPETQSKTEAAVVEDDTADDHETRHSIELNQLQSARHRSIHKKDKAGDGIDLEAAPISPKRWESSSKRDAAPNRLDDQSLQVLSTTLSGLDGYTEKFVMLLHHIALPSHVAVSSDRPCNYLTMPLGWAGGG